MKFLIDTDICSAHMRRPASLAHRFIQYTGAIGISAVSLGELYAGAHKHPNSPHLLKLISDLRQEVTVVDFNETCAEMFGLIRGTLLKQGISVPTTDLMIGVSAIVHGVSLVTHNVKDFVNIPGLQIEDWLKS